MESETSSDRIEPGSSGSRGEHEEEELSSPLFQVAGIFAIGEPGWADRHDEYLTDAYIEDHIGKNWSESERKL